MNKSFCRADTKGKLAIFDFLMEDRIAMHFYFHESAHNYFKEKYPSLYSANDGKSLGKLRKHGGELNLFAIIKSVDTSTNSIIVRIARFQTGDAEMYDDTSIILDTTPSNPEGFDLRIPIEHIEGILAVHKYPLPSWKR